MAIDYAISTKSPNREAHRQGFVQGYTASQETHPFSKEDMVEFAEWRDGYLPLLNKWQVDGTNYSDRVTTESLIDIWKSKRPKTLYFQ